MDYEELMDFIENKMKMTNVYQPIMIEKMLKNDGTASAWSVAKEFLSSDYAQLDYYIYIVNRWPRITLKKHGVITESGKGNRNRMFTLTVPEMTREQRENLIDSCRHRLNEYKMCKGLPPHGDGLHSPKAISGSKRYRILSRSAGRCVACGVSSQERAIEVDHIIPRSKGGPDELSNLQALCYKCNSQKRDRDDLDFLLEINRKAFSHKGCFLCRHRKMDAENFLAGAAWIKHPYTKPHAVIMPKRHVPNYFELRPPERAMMNDLLEAHLAREDPEAWSVSDRRNAGKGIFGEFKMRNFRLDLETSTSADESRHCAIHVVPLRARKR